MSTGHGIALLGLFGQKEEKRSFRMRLFVVRDERTSR